MRPRHFGSRRSAKLFGASLGLHVFGVVGDGRERRAPRRVEPVRVGVLAVMLRHVLRHVRGKPALALPQQVMGGIRGVDDVGVGDVAAVFLADALEQALGARALDLDFDAGIFLTEARPDLLGGLDVDRGVEDDLALFLRRLDERRRDRGRLGKRRRGQRGGDKPKGAKPERQESTVETLTVTHRLSSQCPSLPAPGSARAEDRRRSARRRRRRAPSAPSPGAAARREARRGNPGSRRDRSGAPRYLARRWSRP